MGRLQSYSYFRSSAAFRVRIALHLKQIPHDYHAVHLLKDGGRQNQAAYRDVNPMGEVPAIVDGDFNLAQSMAILFYLDDIRPKPELFPKEPRAKARVLQICENINCGMHPLQNLKVLQELERRFGAQQAAKDSWVQHWISLGFQSLEKILESTAGTYAFGGSITAADLFIVPQVFSARRFKCDLAPFPVIRRIADECMRLEAFKKSEPAAQPDTPPEGV
jgi:maleylacetoacetate isomerase